MAVQFPRHPDYRLPRKRHMKSPMLFQEAFVQGRCCAGKLMVMRVRTGAGAQSKTCPPTGKIGVAAGRSCGGAVQRNRAKRRLLEAFRLNRHRIQDDCDIVLIARSKIIEADWNELQAELIALAGKAGILTKEQK